MNFYFLNHGGDQFGCSLSLSSDGNTLIVEAYGEYSEATGVGGDQSNDLVARLGAVYLY